MRVFKCSQCGCQMEYIGNYQYQCPNCGDIADYSELVNGCKSLFKRLISAIQR